MNTEQPSNAAAQGAGEADNDLPSEPTHLARDPRALRESQATTPASPIYADFQCRARSQLATAFIEHISVRVLEWERQHGRRKKARSERERLEFLETLERLIGSLLRANALGPRGIYRSLNRNNFDGDLISYRNFKAAVDAMAGLSLIDHVRGAPRYVRAFGGSFNRRGKASVFSATPELIMMAEAAGLTGPIDIHFGLERPEPLALRGNSAGRGKFKDPGPRLPIDYGNPHVAKLANEVQALNEFLSRFKIEGGIHYGYQRKFNCGDSPDFRWNKGGRLFSIGATSYQSMPRSLRNSITIADEKTVEIDIRASNLTIFHALLKEPFSLASDPYAFDGLDRDLVKAWTNTSLGASRLVVRWPAETSKKYAEEHGGLRPTRLCKAAAVRDQMVSRFPALMRLGQPSAPDWADLMWAESQVMISTMTALRLIGIPSLSMHDGIIVPQEYVVIASALLAEKFLNHVGVLPHLATKSTLPDIQWEIDTAVETRGRIVEAAKEGQIWKGWDLL